MNYNTTYWRTIRNGTCYSQVRHFLLMSLLLFWRMTSECPSRPFARCKTADFAFWAEQKVRETSRFFKKNPKELYFCPVRFCQDESATSHTYEALTNYLILATIDGSRRNLFVIKGMDFGSPTISSKNPRRLKISLKIFTTKVPDSMALVFRFPTYHPTW